MKKTRSSARVKFKYFFVFCGLSGCLFLSCAQSSKLALPEPEQQESAEAEEQSSSNTVVNNFSDAKRWLSVLYERGQTFDCACPFKDKVILIEQCSYRPRKNNLYASLLEWDHVMPASRIGKKISAWHEGDPQCQRDDRQGRRARSYRGRKCARRVSEEFRRMEADLYNIVPSIAELNRLRGDLSFDMIEGEERQFGECDFEWQKQRKGRAGKVEPRPEVRGDIARIYFYMEMAYHPLIELTAEEKKRLQEWSDADPVRQEECEIYRLKKQIQRNDNLMLEKACQILDRLRPPVM